MVRPVKEGVFSELHDFAAAGVRSHARDGVRAHGHTARPPRRSQQHLYCRPLPGARCLPCEPEASSAESCLETGSRMRARCFDRADFRETDKSHAVLGYQSCDESAGQAAFMNFEFLMLVLFCLAASAMARRKLLSESEFSKRRRLGAGRGGGMRTAAAPASASVDATDQGPCETDTLLGSATHVSSSPPDATAPTLKISRGSVDSGVTRGSGGSGGGGASTPSPGGIRQRSTTGSGASTEQLPVMPQPRSPAHGPASGSIGVALPPLMSRGSSRSHSTIGSGGVSNSMVVPTSTPPLASLSRSSSAGALPASVQALPKDAFFSATASPPPAMQRTRSVGTKVGGVSVNANEIVKLPRGRSRMASITALDKDGKKDGSMAQLDMMV